MPELHTVVPATAQRAPLAEVALATFNSERFLPQLLDSLFSQTCQDFTLLVADDCSTDSTPDIIAAYQNRHRGRIRKIDFDRRAGSALANFSRLTDHLTARYVLFCDHDDVWLPSKIGLSLERMRSFEAENPPGTPLLVHTDLIVVDDDLQRLHRSMSRYQNLNPTKNGFRDLLKGNMVTGCAMIVNRALYERARPIPPEAVMHDHWLALVGATIGKVRYVDESTILYRRHRDNALGVSRWGSVSIMERVRQTLFEDSRRRQLERLSRQAAALLARHGSEMTTEQCEAAATLAGLWSISRWRRFGEMKRHGLSPRGLVRSLAFFITLARGGQVSAP